MKKLLCVMILMVSVLAIITISNCGGGSGGNPPSTIPVALEGLDGASGVAVDASFAYTFDAAVDTATVSTNTFFIVPTLAAASANISATKSEYSTDTCNTDYALDTSVTCDSSTSCILDPTNNLDGGTSYTVCLNDILYADASSWFIRSAYAGDPITPVAITFVTESDSFGIAAVIDSLGKPVLPSGSTGIGMDQLTIYFTEDIETGAESDINCSLPEGSGLHQPSVSGFAPTDSSATLVIEDGYQYQLLNCTLTVGSGFTGASGESLGSDATYSFTAGCAIGDAFRIDSKDCWEVASDGFWSTWDELIRPPGILSYGVDGLSYDSSGFSAADRTGVIGKEITVSEDGFQIDLHIDSIVVTSPDGIDTVMAGMVSELSGQDIELATVAGFVIGLTPVETTNITCMVAYVSTTGEVSQVVETCDGGEFYLRLTVDSDKVSSQYSTDGITYNNIDDVSNNWPPSGYSFDDYHYFILNFETDDTTLPAPSTTCTIQSINATGVTSSTQY